MAGEPEQLGGISIDIGINDAQVEARLAQLEARLAKLVDKTYNVKIGLPGAGSGKAAPGTPGGAPVQLQAVLKVENAAAVRQKIAALGNFTVPITLKLTQTEINRVKTQIKQAFENFTVPIKVTYAGAVGQPHMMANVVAGGPAMTADDDEVVPGTNGSVRRSGGRGRTVSLGPRTLQRDTVTAKLTQLIDTLTKERTTQLYNNAPRAALNRMQADINARQRQLMVVESSPDDVSLRQYPELARFASGTATSGPRKRGLTAKPPVVRRAAYVAPTIAEQVAQGIPPDQAYVSHVRANFGQPNYYAPATIRGPEALAAEAADRERRGMGRTQRAMEGEGRPTERQFRAFDRAPLYEGGPRRRGPRRTYAMAPRTGFLSPFAPNDVQREYDPQGPYPQEPEARGILERFRTGGYGTRAEPGYAQIGDEGQIERVFAHNAERFARFRRAGISTSPGQPFRYGRRTLRIMSPSQLARRAVSMLGTGISEADRNKMEAAFKNRNFDPDANLQASYGGGYKGVSTGFGPAAMSSRDTPAGNALNQQRVAETSYQEAVAGLDAFDRASLKGEIGRGRDKFEALQAILADPERRSRMDTSGDQRRLEGAFSRYKAGYAGRAGLGGYLAEDAVANPRSVYGAFVRKFATQYRASRGMRQKGRLGGLPKELQEQIRGHRGVIYGDQAEIEAASNRISGTERLNGPVRARNRTYALGGAEQEFAETGDAIRAIMGAPDRYGVDRTPGAGRKGAATYIRERGTPGRIAGLGMTDALAMQDRLVGLIRRRVSAMGPANAEFEMDRMRGALGGNIVGEPKVLSGDVYSQKVMASARTARQFNPYLALGAPRAPGAQVPTAEGLRATVNARYIARQNIGGEQMNFGFGPAGPAGPLTGMGGGPSGSIVPVRVVNFSELKGNLFMKGEAPSKAARAAEEVEEGVSAGTGGGATPRARRAARLIDQYKIRYLGNVGDSSAMPGSPRYLREERTARLAEEREAKTKAREERAATKAGALPRAATMESLARQAGFELTEANATNRQGKSDADIEAEAQILEARSLNPTRAFQTAIAAAFAKTIGGGGAFEERVKGLSSAIGQRRGVERQLESTAPEYRALGTSIRRLNAEIDNDVKATGSASKDKYKLHQVLVEQFKGLQEERQGQLHRRGQLTEEVAQRRQSLLSPGGVVRGFAALGAGAIAGGIIFSAAQAVVQSAIEVLSTQAERGADALSGFALTANRVTRSMADAIRGAGGDVNAIAGAAASSGISAGALSSLGLTGRAQALAAQQARVEASDIFRSANFVGGAGRIGGVDANLFQGTGGLFNTQLGASAPGVMERIADDLKAFQQPLARGTSQDPRRNIITGTTELTTKYVADLNEQLQRAGSGFKVLTDATTEQRDAFRASAASIDQNDIGQKMANAGIVIVNAQGQVVSGGQFGQAAQAIGQGQTIPDAGLQFQADQRGIRAQIRQLGREQQQELNFSIPTEAALGNLANPLMAPGSTVAAANAQEQAKIETSTAHTQELQNQLNDSYAKGNDLLKQSLPPDLYQNIKQTGEAIAQIQTNIAKAQANLQAAEYNNQLRIAKRSLNDILQLQGKRGKGESDGLGAIERQNVMLQRQSQLLAIELQQRQINFQLAIAGFQTPGDTPEERAARRRDAQTQAEFAQKQLDIQKKLFGNEIKVFDIQNLRAAEDALASIGLLKQGRAVALDTAQAQEDLARLGKIQDQNLKKAGTYLNRIEKEISIASGELTKLEAAYGEALSTITEATIKGFIKTVSTINTYLGNIGPAGPAQSKKGRRDPLTGANGLFGMTSGPTMFLAGEVKGEAVAIIKNPKLTGGNMGGGGGPTVININGPVVRQDGDIAKIADAVERVLNRRVALLGMR